MDKLQEQALNLYTDIFGSEAKFVARAPGRVNLIGEHTDYNEGFVFPMAIDRAVWIAFTPNQSNQINIVAGDFDKQHRTIDLAHLQASNEDWLEYVKGMAHQLQQHFGKTLQGFDGVIVSQVPIGAGLSSSAALELAVARALIQSNKLEWPPVTMAKLAQQAENEWVGVNCGIMDQLISAVGEAGHAVLIDCRDLSYEAIPLPKNSQIIIMDTSTRRGLVDSHYNERREQCQQGAERLGLTSLRNASLAQVEQLKEDEKVYRRARHVVSENKRTLKAKDCMLNNDADGLGALFKQSHQSLAEDFEVTNEALDKIVKIANHQGCCYGARMTGAGFGGCAVALVNSEKADKFCDSVTKEFAEETGLKADIHVVKAEDGVTLYINDA